MSEIGLKRASGGTPVKVFGIGFHKTGTKSLKSALTKLGYRVTGPNGIGDPHIAENAWSLCKALIDEFDGFQDNPWPVLYPQIYQYRPDAKFILTIRPADQWLASIVRYFGAGTTPMREWIYGAGSPRGNEALYRERYERHNREVLEFFAAKPTSLLVMDFAAGDGWEKLCGFLGESQVPSRPFPYLNVRSPEHQNTSRRR